jgi:elongation factor Ts
MAITTEQVKALRDKTSLSIMQCHKALEEAGGDMEKAIVILQKRSGEIAQKKSERTLGAGIVSSYIHAAGSVGAIVELSCETDFVAKNEGFKALAYDLAMQVAATDPQFLKMEDINEEARKTASEVFAEEVKDKPEDLKAKILEGKLNAYFGENTLMEQPFIKNPDMKIKDLITGAVQKFGERTEIRRFVRFSTRG